MDKTQHAFSAFRMAETCSFFCFFFFHFSLCSFALCLLVFTSSSRRYFEDTHTTLQYFCSFSPYCHNSISQSFPSLSLCRGHGYYWHWHNYSHTCRYTLLWAKSGACHLLFFCNFCAKFHSKILVFFLSSFDASAESSRGSRW